MSKYYHDLLMTTVKLTRSAYAQDDKSWLIGEKLVTGTNRMVRQSLGLEGAYIPGLDGKQIIGIIDHEKGEWSQLRNTRIDEIVGSGKRIDELETLIKAEHPTAPSPDKTKGEV